MTDGGKDVYIGSTVTTSLVGFGSMRAYQVLTTTDVFSDAETVTIDGKVYTFQTVLTDVDGHVLIGGSTEATIDNLVLAITLGAGAGTNYATSTTAHTTCTGKKNTAATFWAVALDAGTGGNSIAIATDCANASWGAGTLAGGDTGGAVMNNVWAEGFEGDINTNGSAAQITFNKMHLDGTYGSAYLDVQTANRLIVNSYNRFDAATVTLTAAISNVIEVVEGHLALDWNGLTGTTTVVWVDGIAASLTLTGTGTVPVLVAKAGVVTSNGPTITAYYNDGGTVTHSSGAITTLESGGYFQLDATQTLTTGYITGGTFTTTQTTSGKTITAIFVGPSVDFTYAKDRDTIGNLRYIGEMGEF